jgi:tetratricopeptide (TPR) repeat protein
MNKKYIYLIIVLLIAASLAAYGRILGNEFVNYDDNLYITENSHVKSGINAATIKWAMTDVHTGHWHPLAMLSHALDWSLFKDNAGGHHLVNLLLHIGNTLLLFFLLNKITNNLWPSAFAAALFALHPLRVESVAWAAERKDVLSMFFGLWTLYAYAFYVAKPQVSKYILCLVLFALGLMAKAMLVTLPFVLLLLDFWPLKRWEKEPIKDISAATPAVNPQIKKKAKKRKLIVGKALREIKPFRPSIGFLVVEKAPFFILIALSIGMTFYAAQSVRTISSALSLTTRIINMFVSYAAYIGKIFWPVDLAVFYPYQHVLPFWQFLGALLILLLISAVVILYIRKLPFLFVGWFWYLGTLIPVIGLVQVGPQALADRYTYLPSIGIGIMLAWGIPCLLPSEKMRKIILIPAAAIVLVVLSVLTWRQCGYWKNSITLYNYTLQVTDNNALAHYNLGIALQNQGNVEKAIPHFKLALNIDPSYDSAHYNLGVALQNQGNIEEAFKHFLETVRINPHSPDAHNRMGTILAINYKKYDQAIYHFRQALQIDQSNPDTHVNLAIALANQGELKEAIEHFRTAIYLNPNDEQARQALREVINLEQGHRQRIIK